MSDRRLREVVLDATVFLVHETGTRDLTLETIAAHADVDPAAVVAEFPTLELLGVALVERIFRAFLDEIAAAVDDEEAPQAFTRGFIRAMRGQVERRTFPTVAAALMRSVPDRPLLRAAVIRERTAILGALLADGLDGGDALLVWSALDGLFLRSVLDIDHIDDAMRCQLFDRLEAFVVTTPPAAD